MASTGSEDWPRAFEWMRPSNQHFDIFLVGSLAVAIFVLVASIELLRLRAWARTALEVMSWLHLAYFLLLGVGATVGWLRMIPQLEFPVPEGHASPAPYLVLAVVIGMLMFTAAVVIPTAAIIHFLRSKVVREAVGQIAGPSAD